MGKYLDLIKQKLNEMHINYNYLEDDAISLKILGDRWESGVYIIKVNEAPIPNCSILTSYISQYNRSKREQALQLINRLNTNLRWIKFVLDEENRVHCQNDTLVVDDLDHSAIFCLTLMIKAIDSSYPELKELEWN